MASRYYKLSAEQAGRLHQLTKRDVTWRVTHNCASWAHEIVRAIVHEDVKADRHRWFLETPGALMRSIWLLEARDPTSRLKPKDMTTRGK
ncbi:MAG: hypothetical protein [Olavius algarvensis Gamma 1 endosymbiont]|nr:MAG: hypothetical protein [Olavius algarvensis Gamma 1 endosymbiont]